MFSGIIENIGIITKIEKEDGNIHFTLNCDFVSELQIDQSVAHNGVCLTVVAVFENEYTVTAIDETLQKTNLGDWAVGSKVNLERCIRLNDRLDGHIVQGHVDQTGKIIAIKQEEGSYIYTINYLALKGNVTVEKGSITANGTSLTVIDSQKDSFSVAIIPYTYENTIFHTLKESDTVNLEFDIIGKYIARLMPNRC